jgi:hypothetical protein
MSWRLLPEKCTRVLVVFLAISLLVGCQQAPGHLAIELAATPVAAKMSLWVLLLASELLDLLSFGFQAMGIDDFGVSHTVINRGVTVLSPASIPWPHGLFMSVIWSVGDAD